MIIQRTFLFILIILLIGGCIPDPIDIDVSPSEPRLVVSSYIIPQKIMTVLLTKSFSPLEPLSNQDSISQDEIDKILVSNAFVTVAYNNRVDTLKMLTAGIYVSTNTLLLDYGTYTLYAYDPSTGLSIIAVTNLLPQVKFDTLYPSIVKNPGDTVVSINYEISDNLNEENYYVGNFILKQPSKGANLDISSYFGSGSNKILSVFDLLNDASFTDGKLIKTMVISPLVKSSDTVAVELANISKGYYEFLTAYKRSSKLMNQLTGEPINYPSNVQNGYGYFNAHYPDGKIFFLKNY
ncbi:MAG: DUF4249 family protein [Bacteroidota bacterium]